MKNTVIALLTFLLPLSAFADFQDCMQFVGKWVTIPNAYYTYSRFEISFDASHIVLIYPDQNNHSIVLIPDGVTHPGVDPNWEGTQYTLTCAPTSMVLVRNLTLLVAPLKSEFKVINNQLIYTDTVTGFKPQTMGVFNKVIL